MSAFQLNTQASLLLLHTKATGLLARFAHDLEIACSGFSALVSVDGEIWNATLSIPVSGLSVVGVLHGERVDKSVLSDSDRAEIEKKIRQEVFSGRPNVQVTAQGAARVRGEAKVSVGSKSETVQLAQKAVDKGEGKIEVTGRCEVSMKKLGLEEVKGPLGAFKLSDTVAIVYSMVLVPA